jgi:hypothetical protein
LDAARLCGDVHLHLFGHPGDLAIHARDLLDEGRLQLLGVLDEDELATFYAGLDCVVHTETFAGWANLAAEGMACGVPVICTPHGTGAFADHETTALLVSNPTPHEFAEAIQRLRNDPHLAAHLARNARQRILPFSWTSYSAALLRLMRPQDTKYYSWSPERGLFGKWPEVARLAGLEPLLAKCDRKSVLDLGAAEGVIARNFLDHGATLVHGFEREPSRVRLAASICDNTSRAQFWEADLSDWDDFEAAHCSNLRDLYDIVLYLGLHQHLPAEKRMRALAGAATRSSHWLAIRMPTALFAADGVEQFLADRRFVCVNGHAKDKLTALGASYLFRYCN